MAFVAQRELLLIFLGIFYWFRTFSVQSESNSNCFFPIHRLPFIHLGLGECVPKIFVSIWFIVKHWSVESLVHIELARFSSCTESDACPLLANGMVSPVVYRIFTLHGHKYVARNSIVRCGAGDANRFTAKGQLINWPVWWGECHKPSGITTKTQTPKRKQFQCGEGRINKTKKCFISI